MWSIRHKYISQEEDNRLAKCRVCKQQTPKIRVVEKKTLQLLVLIPIPLGKTSFEICQSCRARVRIKTHDNSVIDANLD